jgi:hypothetical protein
MNFELHRNIGAWLPQLNGKTVDKIFQVDFNNDRQEDIYLPWLFFVTFTDLDKFLEIEGDFDGSHIKIDLDDISQLERKLKEYNLTDNPDLWRVYETSQEEIIHQLLGQRIRFIEFGVDKDEFVINGTISKGQKDVFIFIRFHCDAVCLTIFEGSATGLGVSNDPKVKMDFEETFEVFNTKENNR